MMALANSVPKSERMRRTGPKTNRQFCNKAFAIVFASLLGMGTIIQYLEKSQIIVNAYLDWLIVLVKGPMVSIMIDSNGADGVSVITIFSLFVRFGLFTWQKPHCLIKWDNSRAIFGQ